MQVEADRVAPCRRLDCGDAVEHLDRLPQQLAPEIVQTQLAPGAVEEWAPELPFEVSQRHAGGRLGHADGVGSAGGVALRGDGDDDLSLMVFEWAEDNFEVLALEWVDSEKARIK